MVRAVVRRILYVVALALVTLGTGPASPARQPLLLVPTHQWDFQTADSVVSQRGGTTGTFARAQADSRITADVFASVGVDTASITEVLGANVGGERSFSSNTATGYRAQIATTYELLGSTAMDGIVWQNLGTPVVTADATADPFGANTAELIEDDSAAAEEGRTQSVTITANTSTWTATVWVGCASAHTAGLTLTIGAATTTLLGTCGNWEKWMVSVANPGTETTATVKLSPAGTTVGNTGSTFYSYAQLYNSPYERLGEIAVAGAALTRSKEVLEYSSLSPNSFTDTTWCGWVWLMELPTTGSEIPLVSWGGTLGAVVPSWELSVDSDGDLRASITGIADTSTTETVDSVVASTWAHVCAAWTDGTDFEFYINGTLTTYTTHDETWTALSNFGTVTGFLQGSDERVVGTAVLSRVKMWTGRKLLPGQIRSLYNREAHHY